MQTDFFLQCSLFFHYLIWISNGDPGSDQAVWDESICICFCTIAGSLCHLSAQDADRDVALQRSRSSFEKNGESGTALSRDAIFCEYMNRTPRPSSPDRFNLGSHQFLKSNNPIPVYSLFACKYCESVQPSSSLTQYGHRTCSSI